MNYGLSLLWLLELKNCNGRVNFYTSYIALRRKIQ
jgi:hypothetical protein